MPFFTTKSGYKVYYERHGQSGPVVVLLHGLASSSRLWIRQIRTLQKHFQVYALDFPGHGQSDRWERYSINGFAELLKEWMDASGIQKANLVALSLGCSVALSFAVQYPERVSALVLEGPVGGCLPCWHPRGLLDWLMFKPFPWLLALSVQLFGHKTTARWLNTYGVKAKRSFKVLESVQAQADFKAVRELLTDNLHPPYVGQLHHVTASALIIRGMQDPMPRHHAEYIHRHLKRAVWIEAPETRHIVSLEKPRAFNQTVIQFLKSVNSASKHPSHDRPVAG